MLKGKVVVLWSYTARVSMWLPVSLEHLESLLVARRQFPNLALHVLATLPLPSLPPLPWWCPWHFLELGFIQLARGENPRARGQGPKF